MALVVTVPASGNSVQGNKRVSRGTLAFDSSYPTGGEAYLDAHFGMVRAERINIPPFAGFSFEIDYTNKKIKVINGGISAHSHTLHFQTAAAANAVTAAANALRTPAAAFDVAGVADSAGEGGVVSAAGAVASEVANGTNLAALTAVPFEAIGY